MRRYQGQHRAIAELAHGGVVILKKPDDLTPAQFARSVNNAVTHFGNTRGRRFKTRSTLTGVEVTRIHTEAEFAQWVRETAPGEN